MTAPAATVIGENAPATAGTTHDVAIQGTPIPGADRLAFVSCVPAGAIDVVRADSGRWVRKRLTQTDDGAVALALFEKITTGQQARDNGAADPDAFDALKVTVGGASVRWTSVVFECAGHAAELSANLLSNPSGANNFEGITAVGNASIVSGRMRIEGRATAGDASLSNGLVWTLPTLAAREHIYQAWLEGVGATTAACARARPLVPGAYYAPYLQVSANDAEQCLFGIGTPPSGSGHQFQVSAASDSAWARTSEYAYCKRPFVASWKPAATFGVEAKANTPTPDITAIATASGDTSVSFASGLQAGDVIIAQAFRDGDTTIPSTPSSTWQTLGTLAGTGCAARYCIAVATGSSFSSGTFANASSVHAIALRGVNATHAIGDILLTESADATVNLGNLNRWLGTNANCNSKALLMVGHRGSGATLAAPSGFTQQADAAQNNTRVASHLHTAKAASYGGGSISSGVSERSISMAVEILSAKDVVTLGSDTLLGHGAFSAADGWNPTGSWSIDTANTKAVCTASSNAYLEHAGSNNTSKLYKVKLDISGLTAAIGMGDSSTHEQRDDIAATNRVWQSRPSVTEFTIFNFWSGAATIKNVTAQEISVAPA